MNIDFRQEGKLDESLIPLLDIIASKSREKYNSIITQSSLPLKGSLSWWSENVSSRNTYACPLFNYICYLELTHELVKKGFSIDRVYVDSHALYEILISDFRTSQKNIEIIYKPSFRLRFKNLLTPFYYEWFLLVRLSRLICSKLLLKKISFSDKDYILIDTFISRHYVDNDRWYGAFWENLNESQKEDIFFVPSITDQDIFSFIKICRSLGKSTRKVIIKEQFLGFKDIFSCYLNKFSVSKLKIGASNINGIDTTNLVQECLMNNRDIFSKYEALLTYFFIKNLSSTELKVKLSIDWFEGHCVDKLWNLAMHDYFPKAKLLAYETFRSFPYYLSTYPIPIEIDSKVVPSCFAVQGKGCHKHLKEFYSDLDVITVPAFKNLYLWENKDIYKTDNQTVLIALPISIEASIYILRIMITSLSNSSPKNIHFLIKPHPSILVENILKKLGLPLPENFIVTDERSFPVLLSKSSLLISEASSVCLEALAIGKPVVLIQNSFGLTYDPIPDDVPESLYRKCLGKEDIQEAINFFLEMDEASMRKNIELSSEIRKKYFEPLSEEGISRFLKS